MPSYWAEIKDQKIVEYCKSWYRRKSESEWIAYNDLPPFREMLQRVSAKLNTMPWKQMANVTEDFVVFPADASHTFSADYEEMVASIPVERIESFRERKLLGLLNGGICDVSTLMAKMGCRRGPVRHGRMGNRL